MELRDVGLKAGLDHVEHARVQKGVPLVAEHELDAALHEEVVDDTRPNFLVGDAHHSGQQHHDRIPEFGN